MCFFIANEWFVWFGLKTQSIALFLQKYGNILLGPLLLLIGGAMLNLFNFKFLKLNNKLNKYKEKIAKKGFFGSFLFW